MFDRVGTNRRWSRRPLLSPCAHPLNPSTANPPHKKPQFERTLIICEEGAYVSYLEGCTAPAYDTNQLHAAVVELYAAKDAEIKYSTVQNWWVFCFVRGGVGGHSGSACSG